MECKNCQDAEKCDRKLELAIAGVTGWKCLHEFSLENVIEHLNTLMDRRVLSDEWTDLIDRAVELLKEQQPKTGHWEVLTMCANEGTYCSVCHTKIFDFVHPPKKKLSQYCPHCGAKMEEPTEV